MIILASAIILALSGNGIIGKSNKAKFQNDMSTMKEELSVYISNKEVVRNVEVIDDTGTLPLEQSLRGLDTPIREKITVSGVMLNEGTNIIEVLTKVQPSKIETMYYKK